MAETIIHFYSCLEPADPRVLISRIVYFLKPEAILVGRGANLDNSWDRFKSDLDDEGLSSELLLEPRDLNGALDEYQPIKSFGLALIRCPIVMELNEEYRINVPEKVRANHWPCETSLLVNPHDIFEDFLDERGHYFARAFISLKLWGDSHPSDFVSYQKRVSSLTTFQELQRGMEQIIGKLDCAFYMQG